jgi:hypothetical protein
MFSCDYNGWADVPEEEREAIDAYESENPAAELTAYTSLEPRLMWVPARTGAELRAA